MKTGKRVLSIFLAVMMVLLAMPVAFAHDDTISSPFWGDVNNDGKANFQDVLKLNKIRLNKNEATLEQLCFGDVNLDGEITLSGSVDDITGHESLSELSAYGDLVLIQAYKLNKIKSFPAESLAKITFHAPTKTTLKKGEAINTTGMSIVVENTKDSRVKYTITENIVLSGYNPWQIGDQRITASFRGLTYGFNITVEERDFHGFDGGDGTKADPYLISTPEQLDAVRNFLSSCFRLTNDLFMGSFDFWEPIGTDSSLYGGSGGGNEPEGVSSPFTGVFDGNGFGIHNLNIHYTETSYLNDMFGLFGAIKNATVKNVNLWDVNFFIDKSTTDYAQLYKDYAGLYAVFVGGISGESIDSTVKNCFTSGSITVLHTCTAFVGGIVGMGEAQNCINRANICVVADKGYRDKNDSEVNCGGIVGRGYYTSGHIFQCVNYGNIELTAGDRAFAGGISGLFGTIENCANHGMITGMVENISSSGGWGSNCCIGGIVSNSGSEQINCCVNYGDIDARCINVPGSLDNQPYLFWGKASAGGIAGYYGGIIQSCVCACKSIVSFGTDEKGKEGFAQAERIDGIYYEYELDYAVIKDTYALGTTLVNGATRYGTASDNHGINCTAEDLLKQETYKGFDFENIWYIDEDIGGANLKSAYSDVFSYDEIVGTFDDYITTVILNAGTDYSSISDIIIDGKQYKLQKGVFGDDIDNYKGKILRFYLLRNTVVGFEPVAEDLNSILDIEMLLNTNSSVYSHELARYGIRITRNSGNWNNDTNAIKSFYKLNDFGNNANEAVMTYGYDKTETDGIACTIANKNIDDSDTSIIIIGIRGDGYGWEWGGNFNVGSEGDHDGFALAAEQVVLNLERFLNNTSVKLNRTVKMFITGFSRAAATANLTAATLDNFIDQNNASSPAITNLIQSKKLLHSNLYSYTYETPRCTNSSNTDNSLYNNIFNLVNPIDPVPKVAPADWGFRRYGKDYYYPSAGTTSNYADYENKMSKVYTKINRDVYEEEFAFYELAVDLRNIFNGNAVAEWRKNETVSQGVYLDNLIRLISTNIIKNRANYVANYQNAAQLFLSTGINSDQSNGFSLDFNDLISALQSTIQGGVHLFVPGGPLEPFKKVIASFISGHVKADNPNFPSGKISYDDAYRLVSQLDDALITALAHYNYSYSTYQFMSKMHDFKNGYPSVSLSFLTHYPEVSQAWLESTTEKDLAVYSTYRVAKINCPVNVKVYSSNGTLVADMVDDEAQKIEGSTVSAYIDENGSKCFVLPNDDDYYFEITGTDEGVMSCSVVDYDYETMEEVYTQNYYDLPVSKGKVYTGLLSELDGNETKSDFDIMNDDLTEVQVAETFETNEAPLFTVAVESNDESCTVIGDGAYKQGDYAQVTAIPSENHTFSGWYKANKCVSSDYQYRFRVDADVTLTAKFAPVVQPHTHTYTSTITTPATCTEPGEATYTCSCGDTYTETIPALGHTDDNNDGHCDNCGEQMTGGDHCKFCGKIHNGGFFDKLTGFFHKIFAIFKR